MSLQEDAHVKVLVADYAAVDTGGKINMIGAGFTITSIQPTGATPPMYLVVLIDLPSRHVGTDFALSLELRDDTNGEAFKIPGQSGSPEPLRIQQVVRAERAVVPGVYLPSTMPLRVQFNLGFTNGLPLQPGHDYRWQAEIDGQAHEGWSIGFHVAGPPPGPVIGGPSGPASIPSL